MITMLWDMDTRIALHKLHAYCTGVDTRLNEFRKVWGQVKENEIFTTPARPSTSQVITGAEMPLTSDEKSGKVGRTFPDFDFWRNSVKLFIKKGYVCI